jgi:hypothetical protein
MPDIGRGADRAAQQHQQRGQTGDLGSCAGRISVQHSRQCWRIGKRQRPFDAV